MAIRPNASALRSEIEKALDEIISNEEGMRFQGLAVVLARQRRPELVASERKNDWGLDAHVSAAGGLATRTRLVHPRSLVRPTVATASFGSGLLVIA